jgi:hypothetical protein
MFAAMGHITGQSATYTMTSPSTSFTTFVNAYNSGKMIGFASYETPQSTSVVGSHAYAVVGYNATNQTVTLFNPWGIQYGLITMSWSRDARKTAKYSSALELAKPVDNNSDLPGCRLGASKSRREPTLESMRDSKHNEAVDHYVGGPS